MRTDMIHRDGQALREFIDANMEFAGLMMAVARARSSAAGWLPEGRPPHHLAATTPIDGETLSPNRDRARDGPLHRRGRRDHPHGHQPRTACVRRPSRPVGGHGRRSVARARCAVDEVLRWVTPLNNFFRRATQDAEVGGQRDPAGERVIMLYPSANRDETVFTDPFAFDIRRAPNPHLVVRVRHAPVRRREPRS
jgi:hypothetical protein